MQGLRVSELDHLRSLMHVCDVLGKVACQLLNEPLEQITVTLEGDYAKEKPEPLLLAVAKVRCCFLLIQLSINKTWRCHSFVSAMTLACA